MWMIVTSHYTAIVWITGATELFHYIVCSCCCLNLPYSSFSTQFIPHWSSPSALQTLASCMKILYKSIFLVSVQFCRILLIFTRVFDLRKNHFLCPSFFHSSRVVTDASE